MQKTELEKFENTLLTSKKEIETTLQKLKGELDYGSDVDSLEEETDETEEYANYLATKKPLEEKLQRIAEALERIQNGTYGMCEKCKNPIENEVLMALPESTLCKTCKQSA